MLKHARRGQDPAGVDATEQGELALECPACPLPGHNLLAGWDQAGPKSWVIIHHPCALLLKLFRFLYTQFLAIDANFKLKSKDHGISDPELALGWSYFVHEEDYQAFIKGYIDQPEVRGLLVMASHCLIQY